MLQLQQGRVGNGEWDPGHIVHRHGTTTHLVIGVLNLHAEGCAAFHQAAPQPSVACHPANWLRDAAAACAQVPKLRSTSRVWA